MSTIDTVGSQEMSWKVTAIFSSRTPKLVGHRNPAVLWQSESGTMTLETKYDPPGSPWLALLGTTVIVVIAAIVAGPSGSLIGGIGGGGIVVAYALIRWWRQRDTKLELNATDQTIVDEKQATIALLTPIDGTPRWIVLQFNHDFPSAKSAVQNMMGSKYQENSNGSTCQVGHVSRVNRSLVVFLVVIVSVFVIAFVVAVLMGTVFVSAWN